jgi:transcriptional regulator with XRE-family HTH domain
MKIQIENQPADAMQGFFSSPLSFQQKVTVKKLLIVERILERMKALGLNRSQLAAKMEVSPARITTMMDGTNNFTIETLMRAANAVDAELEMAIVPCDHKVRWVTYREQDVHASFIPVCHPVESAGTHFALEKPAKNDEAHAA